MHFFISGEYQLLIGIVGFLSLFFSVITFFKAISIDRKVKKALREKNDYKFFSRKCKDAAETLRGIQTSLRKEKIYNDFTAGKINAAITLLKEHKYLLNHKHRLRRWYNIITTKAIIKKSTQSPKKIRELSDKLDLIILIFEKESKNV